MKLILSIVLALSASFAFAFDSETWFGKRTILDREAERLQAAFVAYDQRIDAAAENLTIPVESFSNGTIKASVSAKRAQFFLTEGFVWAADVVLRQFAADGSVEAQVNAEKCLVDRNSRSAWVEGHALAKYRDTELEGDGIYFSFAEEYVRISTNTEIRIKDIKLDKIENPPQAAPDGTDAKIVSVRSDYDRREGLLMLERDVKIVNGGYSLSGDELYVFTSGTNELKRIVANGNVRVQNGERKGACAKALYVKSDNRVTMFGDGEGSPARLKDEGKNKAEVEGRKITFWLDTEQVEVEGSTITLDRATWGDAGGMKEILGK